MMERIRTAANNIIVKIIFGLIILGFIFTGVGGFLGFGSGAQDEQLYIAKVDGEGINRNTFEKQVQEVIQQNTALIGQSDDDVMLKMIRNSVLSNQIDNYLSYQFAESLNANISDEQVKNAIRQQTVFFENGRFNNQRYLQLLAANGYTPDSYADGLRSNLKQQQVMGALLLSDFALPVDSDISLLENQTRTVQLADYALAKSAADTITVADTDVQNYYDTHQAEFYHDKRVKMKFVANSLADIKSATNVSAAEVAKYYADGKEGTMSPEKRLYSVLSFTHLDEADTTYAELSKLSDQQRLTAKMNDLGWFTLHEQTPELLTNVKLNHVGEITKPVAQDGSYYIIRLDKIAPAQKLPFEFVEKPTHDFLYQQKIDDQYRKQQSKLEQAAKLLTMQAIATESGLPLHESDWIYETNSMTGSLNPEVNAVAFSDEMILAGKPTGNISDIIAITQPEGAYIIQVTDYQEAGVAPFADVQEAIKAKLLAEKKQQRFAKQVAERLEQLKQTGSADGLTFSPAIAVTQNLVDKRINQQTINDIFAVVPAVTGNSYGVALTGNDTAQFFMLTDVTLPEKAQDLSAQIKPEMIRLTNELLAKNLRANAEIKIMPNANL